MSLNPKSDRRTAKDRDIAGTDAGGHGFFEFFGFPAAGGLSRERD
jgi:hypothetical protein